MREICGMVKRILGLLHKDEKKTLAKVTLSILFSALLDFISLASLMPVLYFLLKEGDNKVAIICFSLAAFTVVLAKCILSVRLGKYQSSFTLSLYRRLSLSLFSNYYNKGLLYIKERGYSTLGHSVNYMSYSFSQGIISPLMRILADGLLILLVTVALLLYDWFSVMVLYLSFVPFFAVYIFLVKDKIKTYGKEDFNAKKAQARIVADSFRGYPDLETNNAFGQLQDSFVKGLETISQSRIKLEELQRIPIFISELAIITGLAVMVFAGGENAAVLVGVFAVAAFRLIPALRGILNSYNSIQNSLSCLEVLEEGLNEKTTPADPAQEISFSDTISCEDVSFNYGSVVLQLGTFIIKKGEYIGFKGYSGIGKTTLFNMLLGFLAPATGRITIDGIPLSDGNRASWLKNTGYVPQDPYIFDGTIAQNIALGKNNFNPDNIHALLHKVQLSDWVSSLPDGMNTHLGEGGSTLSGGQKQRIAIARALYKGADVLLLDEATSSVDISTEREINLMLKQLKGEDDALTILCIAHRESTLAYCSRIIDLEAENGI